MSPIRLETPRLIIREYRMDDLLAIHAYARLPHVVQYESWGPNSVADTLVFLEEAIEAKQKSPREVYELCIERREDGRQIGGCGFFIDSIADNVVGTIGYIINPLFWNQGYATEVTQRLITFGFDTLNVAKIRATCDERNVASKRVLEKCGLQLLRVIPNDFIQKNELRTTCEYVYPIAEEK